LQLLGVILWLYLRKGEGLSGRARQLIEYEPVILISPIILLELDYFRAQYSDRINRINEIKEKGYKYPENHVNPVKTTRQKRFIMSKLDTH